MATGNCIAFLSVLRNCPAVIVFSKALLQGSH